MADVGKGFDRLAWAYDGMARLVYGNAIRKAQTRFLSIWPKGARVLIVGGGTGWFLEEVLARTEPEFVCYVDISAKMLQKSRERVEKKFPGKYPESRLAYVQGTIHQLPPQDQLPANGFDIVVTHFYLDLFNGAELQHEIATLKSHLKPGGLWSLSDFAYEKKGLMRPVSRFLVGSMYLFFRLTAGISSRKLEDYPALLEASGLKRGALAEFYGGMIFSGLFSKDND